VLNEHAAYTFAGNATHVGAFTAVSGEFTGNRSRVRIRFGSEAE